MRSRGARPALPRLWPVALGAVVLVVALALLGGARPRRDPSPEPEDAPGRVTLPSATLRTRAQPRAPEIRALPRGARVTILAARGGWLEAETEKGEKGFLPAEAVERDADRDAREKRARTILSYQPVYAVVAEETDVVLAPFPMAPRIGRLKPGDVIPIHSVDHAYFALRTREGEMAFVRSADVDLVPRDPTQPAIVPDSSRGLRRLTVRDLDMPPGPEEIEDLPHGQDQDAERAPAEEEEEEDEGGEVLETAVLVSKVNPVYPDEARREGVAGTVVLEIAIDATGRVTEVDVVRGLPYGLSEAAVEAVRHWHYRPARGPSGPVRSRKMVRILYSLGR